MRNGWTKIIFKAIPKISFKEPESPWFCEELWSPIPVFRNSRRSAQRPRGTSILRCLPMEFQAAQRCLVKLLVVTLRTHRFHFKQLVLLDETNDLSTSGQHFEPSPKKMPFIVTAYNGSMLDLLAPHAVRHWHCEDLQSRPVIHISKRKTFYVEQALIQKHQARIKMFCNHSTLFLHRNFPFWRLRANSFFWLMVVLWRILKAGKVAKSIM